MTHIAKNLYRYGSNSIVKLLTEKLKKMPERSVIIVNLRFMEGMSHFTIKGSVNLP